MKAIVLAAGEGKRMRPLTSSRPKVMLPLAGRPMLEHVLLAAKEAGLTDMLLVVGYRAESVRAHFGDGSRLGLRIEYAVQGEARGTGDALRAAAAGVRGDCLVLNGDTLLSPVDVKRLAGAKGLAVGAKRVEDPRDYGVLVTGADGVTVSRIVEKSDRPPGNLANVGAYRVSEDLLTYLEGLRRSPRGEFEVTDAFNAAVREGHELRAVPVESWLDVSRPWDLLAANEVLMKGLAHDVLGTVEGRVTMQGPVFVDRGAVVKDGTYVEGPVFIGRDARVGPHAYLRASTCLGAGCHVGAGSEVKNSILLEGANAPHLNYVGDSVLGARVNLGAGTVTANLRFDHGPVKVQGEDGEVLDTKRTKFGAVLGDDAQTGINVSLNVGCVLGAGALIGPGKTVSGYVKPGARLL